MTTQAVMTTASAFAAAGARVRVASRAYALALVVGAVAIGLLLPAIERWGQSALAIWLHQEDGVLESIGALACLVAALAFLYLFIRSRVAGAKAEGRAPAAKAVAAVSDPEKLGDKPASLRPATVVQWPAKSEGHAPAAKVTASPSAFVRSRLPMLGLALLLLVMFGEELSWGQRLLEVPTPQWFASQNIQQEFNLHNLRWFHPRLTNNRLKLAWLIASAAYLGALPLVALTWRPLGERLRMLRVPLASAGVGLAMLVSVALYFWSTAAALRSQDLIAGHQAGEAVETAIELLYFVLALETLLRYRRLGMLANGARLAVAFAAVVVVGAGALGWRLLEIARQPAAPFESMAWKRRAERLLRNGQEPQALRALERSIDIWHDNDSAQFQAGAIRLEQGNWEAAMRHFQAVLRISPTNAAAHNGLGIALFRQNRRLEARRHFEAALRVEPGFAAARENLEAIDSLPP